MLCRTAHHEHDVIQKTVPDALKVGARWFTCVQQVWQTAISPLIRPDVREVQVVMWFRIAFLHVVGELHLEVVLSCSSMQTYDTYTVISLQSTRQAYDH